MANPEKDTTIEDKRNQAPRRIVDAVTDGLYPVPQEIISNVTTASPSDEDFETIMALVRSRQEARESNKGNSQEPTK